MTVAAHAYQFASELFLYVFLPACVIVMVYVVLDGARMKRHIKKMEDIGKENERKMDNDKKG